MQQDQGERLTAGGVEQWISYKIRMAQILAYRAFEERMADHGRAPRYLGLLSIIEAHPGQPQSRLAEAVALQRSSLVTILDQLEAEGFVERRGLANDRRANGVWLTASGKKAVARLRAEAVKHERELVEGLSDTDVEALSRALDRILFNLSATI